MVVAGKLIRQVLLRSTSVTLTGSFDCSFAVLSSIDFSNLAKQFARVAL